MHSVFVQTFSHRPPFQLLLDAPFFDACLTHKIGYRDLLPTILGGPVRLMTTACVVHELKTEGSGALFNARRAELRRCPHTGSPVMGRLCIAEIVGRDNKHHYGVCAQDNELRSRMRSVPGVPIMFIYKTGILMMEDPSEATLRRVREIWKGKGAVDETEKRAIERIAPIVEEPAMQRKRKKTGGPNPLSCKKKSRPVVANGKKVGEEGVKKPTRRHRPNK